MAGKFNGSLLRMEIKGTPNRHIANTRDISLNFTMNPINVTDRDDGGWESFIGGVRGFNGKVSGLVNFEPGADKDNVKELIVYGMARNPVDVVFTTKRAGETAFTGSGLISNVQLSTTHEAEVTWNADFQGTGELSLATIV